MNRFLRAPLEPSIKALNASLGELSQVVPDISPTSPPYLPHISPRQLSQVVPDDNGAFEVHALSASAE